MTYTPYIFAILNTPAEVWGAGLFTIAKGKEKSIVRVCELGGFVYPLNWVDKLPLYINSQFSIDRPSPSMDSLWWILAV